MKIRILLADDHSMIREGIKQLLELDSNFIVVGQAGDGLECMKMLQTRTADILLLDVNMPKMNGIEVLQKIKEENILIKVLMLTIHNEVDYLLKAVALIVHEHKEMQIKVRIAGNGSHEKEYKELAKELGISSTVTWLGLISQERAAKEWANMDLGVVYSTLNSESFGVSAVESQACATPVIISDIPGLMEATLPDETSIVVPRIGLPGPGRIRIHGILLIYTAGNYGGRPGGLCCLCQLLAWFRLSIRGMTLLAG